MRYEKSLIVLKNYLGDTVMASPLVRSVADASHATSILGSTVTQQLLRYPNFYATFEDPKNLSNIGQLFRMARWVRNQRFSIGFLVNRSFRSALLLKLGGVSSRIGHDTEGRGWLLTQRIPYRLEQNEAQSYLDLARSSGTSVTHEKPELLVTPQESEDGKLLLQGASVGIQLGARHDYKQVRLPVWREVARAVESKGLRVAFFGGNEEASLVAESGIDGVDLVGSTTIRQTMGALANLSLMLGGDTGVMHMAAALGTPTITAFGPTPVKKWGWFEGPHEVLEAPNQDISKLEGRQFVDAIERVLCASS